MFSVGFDPCEGKSMLYPVVPSRLKSSQRTEPRRAGVVCKERNAAERGPGVVTVTQQGGNRLHDSFREHEKQTKPLRTSYLGYFAKRQKSLRWFRDLGHREDDCRVFFSGLKARIEVRCQASIKNCVRCYPNACGYVPCLVMSSNFTWKGEDSFLPH